MQIAEAIAYLGGAVLTLLLVVVAITGRGPRVRLSLPGRKAQVEQSTRNKAA